MVSLYYSQLRRASVQINPFVTQVSPLTSVLHPSFVVNVASLHLSGLHEVELAVVSSVHHPSLPLKSVQTSVFLKVLQGGNGESTHPF